MAAAAAIAYPALLTGVLERSSSSASAVDLDRLRGAEFLQALDHLRNDPLRRAGSRHHADLPHAREPRRFELVRDFDVVSWYRVRAADFPQPGGVRTVMPPDHDEGVHVLDHLLCFFLADGNRGAERVDDLEFFCPEAEVPDDLAEVLLRLRRLGHHRCSSPQLDLRRLCPIVDDGHLVL